jgi:hypothetical protein
MKVRGKNFKIDSLHLTLIEFGDANNSCSDINLDETNLTLLRSEIGSSGVNVKI